MTDQLPRIPPAVTHRGCPSCGYLVSQQQIELMRIDLVCPRCAKHPMSKFQPLKLRTT